MATVFATFGVFVFVFAIIMDEIEAESGKERLEGDPFSEAYYTIKPIMWFLGDNMLQPLAELLPPYSLYLVPIAYFLIWFLAGLIFFWPVTTLLWKSWRRLRAANG